MKTRFFALPFFALSFHSVDAFCQSVVSRIADGWMSF
jgi:hypothetical protein